MQVARLHWAPCMVLLGVVILLAVIITITTHNVRVMTSRSRSDLDTKDTAAESVKRVIQKIPHRKNSVDHIPMTSSSKSSTLTKETVMAPKKRVKQKIPHRKNSVDD
ncbi:unnamed protein product, partial [Meganyctiphanes norvegica]